MYNQRIEEINRHMKFVMKKIVAVDSKEREESTGKCSVASVGLLSCY